MGYHAHCCTSTFPYNTLEHRRRGHYGNRYTLRTINTDSQNVLMVAGGPAQHVRHGNHASHINRHARSVAGRTLPIVVDIFYKVCKGVRTPIFWHNHGALRWVTVTRRSHNAREVPCSATQRPRIPTATARPRPAHSAPRCTRCTPDLSTLHDTRCNIEHHHSPVPPNTCMSICSKTVIKNVSNWGIQPRVNKTGRNSIKTNERK